MGKDRVGGAYFWVGVASTGTFKRWLKIMLPARFAHLSKSAKTYPNHTFTKENILKILKTI